ncbi:porin [Pectobacterium carotovorum]|nr:porin [Pectobacterium carotovorum]
MKRNILAVVIPALLVAGAANAAEVYNKDGNKLDLTGKITGLHYFSDDKGNNGDQTYARLGFKGETQISSELTGYGRFEYQFNGYKDESQGSAGPNADKTRYAFVGLKFADVGSLDYGRNLGIAYDALAWTDVLPEFGGDSSYTDNLTGRSTGVLTYRNKNFFGLVDGWDFGLQYLGKNDSNSINERNNEEKQNGDGWGISSSYTSDIGVGVVASYAKYDRTNDQHGYGANGLRAGNNGSAADAWATGLKYDANNIYVAAIYGEYRNLTVVKPKAGAVNGTGNFYADQTKVFEAVAQYNFDFGLTPSLAYVSAKAKDDTSVVTTNDYVTKYVSVGATYSFNKNMSTYVDYQINLLKDENAYKLNTDDTVAVGLTYQF